MEWMRLDHMGQNVHVCPCTELTNWVCEAHTHWAIYVCVNTHRMSNVCTVCVCSVGVGGVNIKRGASSLCNPAA